MEHITVTKAELIGKLRANRGTHERQYEEAVAGWHQRVKDELDRLRDTFTIDSDLEGIANLTYSFRKPVSHSDEYKRALDMLEWELGDEVSISKKDFRELVLDEWGWKSDWVATSMQYRSS